MKKIPSKELKMWINQCKTAIAMISSIKCSDLPLDLKEQILSTEYAFRDVAAKILVAQGIKLNKIR